MLYKFAQLLLGPANKVDNCPWASVRTCFIRVSVLSAIRHARQETHWLSMLWSSVSNMDRWESIIARHSQLRKKYQYSSSVVTASIVDEWYTKHYILHVTLIRINELLLNTHNCEKNIDVTLRYLITVKASSSNTGYLHIYTRQWFDNASIRIDELLLDIHNCKKKY